MDKGQYPLRQPFFSYFENLSFFIRRYDTHKASKRTSLRYMRLHSSEFSKEFLQRRRYKGVVHIWFNIIITTFKRCQTGVPFYSKLPGYNAMVRHKVRKELIILAVGYKSSDITSHC
ncbi:hypothetical protein RF11_09645 [Thelohanellus kitauei]|uniref:Uncharacterized protein n=1 Tax=Thelohanellus kitauei TaxID=669202 RepID=A0A0C2NIA2_THEKT|nr:hypothetical protein RF11_09645 [Thelohanellus kitauei]